MNEPKNKYSEDDIISWELSQIKTWPLLGDNVGKILKSQARMRETLLGTTNLKAMVQILPYRKASATSDPDKALSGERPCFLCAANRPREQKALPWEGYEILANPYPLGLPHLTIASKEHRPQLIDGAIRDMARLTRVLPDMAIFYNGPRCGASAPDHLHFQAITKSGIDTTWTIDPELTLLKAEGKARLYAIDTDLTPVPFLEIVSAADADMLRIFRRVMSALPSADPEPMVNIWAFNTREGTRIVIIPRRAHRPSCYGTGEGQLLVSPASLEMSGLFTALSPEQAAMLTEEKITEILTEVSLSKDQYKELCGRLTDK